MCQLKAPAGAFQNIDEKDWIMYTLFVPINGETTEIQCATLCMVGNLRPFHFPEGEKGFFTAEGYEKAPVK
jgi:hypothetical protein